MFCGFFVVLKLFQSHRDIKKDIANLRNRSGETRARTPDPLLHKLDHFTTVAEMNVEF